jgi:putative ABC transport system permease protein
MQVQAVQERKYYEDQSAVISGQLLGLAVFVAIVGSALGCLIALPANRMASAAGGTNFADVAFAFRISATSLVVGMVLTVLMGVAGGVLPAFRAARMPITSALRDA